VDQSPIGGQAVHVAQFRRLHLGLSGWPLPAPRPQVNSENAARSSWTSVSLVSSLRESAPHGSFWMYLDYRRVREEQLMREIGPPCACGRRSWRSEPSRDPERRRFRCSACFTVLVISAKVFQNREAQAGEGQPSADQADELDHHHQQT